MPAQPPKQSEGTTAAQAAVLSLACRLGEPLRDLEQAAATLAGPEAGGTAAATGRAIRAALESVFAALDEALERPDAPPATTAFAPLYLFLPGDPDAMSLTELLRSLGASVTVLSDLGQLSAFGSSVSKPLPLLFVAESQSTRLLAQAVAGRLQMRLVLLCPADRAAAMRAVPSDVATALSRPFRRTDLLRILSSAVVAASPDPPETPVEIAAPVRPPRGRVLVVDDNGMNRAMAQRMIERCGFAVDVADNGARALAAMRAHPYELVLMDCEMPGMDGWTATRAIRVLERSTGRRVPIVALTAGDRDEDRAGCRRAGMDDHLPKPLHADRLGAILRRWAKSRGSSAETPRSLSPTGAPPC